MMQSAQINVTDVQTLILALLRSACISHSNPHASQHLPTYVSASPDEHWMVQTEH